jgi:hypothetical protein
MGKSVNEELHNLYSSPNISKLIKSGSEMGEACSTHGTDEKYAQNFSRVT